jgi:hypothetical protein
LGGAADHHRSDAEVGDSCEKNKAARGEAAHQRMIDHDEDELHWITGAGGAALTG